MPTTYVDDQMLARFRERAPRYDRENIFFQEDWDELKATGFLTCLVPTDLGGAGWSRGFENPVEGGEVR